MVKKIFILIYVKFLSVKNRITNFYIPNIFRLKNVYYKESPSCQQKVIFSGKGKVIIGSKCSFGYKLGGRFKYGVIEIQARTPNAKIDLGNHISTNNNLFICSSNHVIIGNETLIGENVTIMDFEAHGIEPNKRRNIGEIGEVKIGKNVWIGNNVTILKNSEIGDNSIVAAGAIVNKEFPPNVIIGGIPAKIIKSLADYNE